MAPLAQTAAAAFRRGPKLGLSQPVVADRAARPRLGRRCCGSSTSTRGRPNSPRHAQHGRDHRPPRPGRISARAAGPLRDALPAQRGSHMATRASAVAGPHLSAARPAVPTMRAASSARFRRRMVPSWASSPPSTIFWSCEDAHAPGLRIATTSRCPACIRHCSGAGNGRASAAFSGARAVSAGECPRLYRRG